MAFTTNEIIKTLLDSTEGKVLAFNLVHSVQYKILLKEKVSEFLLDWWQPYLSGAYTVLSKDHLINTFNAVIWEGEKNNKKYLLASKITRTTSNTIHGRFYNIKEYETLYNYPLRGYVFDNGDVLPSPDSVDLDAEIEQMQKNKIFDNEFKITFGQCFSPKHGIYWVCPGKDLELIFELTDIATRTRDFLGLAHIGNDSYIVGVMLAPTYMENPKRKNTALRPTPLDAGFHPRFKCLSDSNIFKNFSDESGFTFDLEKQSNKEKNADGGREFIIKEMNAMPVESFYLKPLGKTKSTVDKSELSENDFISRLENIGNFNINDLFTRFENLIA